MERFPVMLITLLSEQILHLSTLRLIENVDRGALDCSVNQAEVTDPSSQNPLSAFENNVSGRLHFRWNLST